MADSSGVGAIFDRIGRTSLRAAGSLPTNAPARLGDTTSSNLGKNLGVSFDLSYGGTGIGRLSAAMLGIAVLALVGFYVVTRSHQA